MAEPTEPGNKTKALARVETSVCGLVLNNLEDMTTVAQVILQSKLAPDSFDTKEKIFVGLQSGAEIGLKPMQSLNSIVVIKGKPTLWGDAALALVKRSGLCEYCHEYFELKGVKISEKDIQYTDIKDYPDTLVAVCETKRKGEPEPVIRYFSVADAKLAHLWAKKGKQGGITPWCTHPKRMLKYKARAFNLRDSYPDVLYGMHVAEELIGEEPLPAPETDVLHRDQRRLTVPSTAVDTTRAPMQEAEKPVPEPVPTPIPVAVVEAIAETIKPDPDAEARAKDANEPQEKPEPHPVMCSCVDCVEMREQQKRAKPKPVCETCGDTGETTVSGTDNLSGGVIDIQKPCPDCQQSEPELVTFQCNKCLRTYRYGKEEGKGVQCECGKGVLKEQGEPETEPAGDKDKKTEVVKSLYIDVNTAYIAQNGQDFIEFASYVLCIDEDEISMNKLTIEQLKQVKAYIETSGVETG